MSGEPESAGQWSGELEADLGLSAGIDLSALLEFESDERGEGGGRSTMTAPRSTSPTSRSRLRPTAAPKPGFASAMELLDVGEDLNDG